MMAKFKDVIISAIVWAWGLLVFSLTVLLLLLVSLFHTGPFFEKLLTGGCRLVLTSMGIRIKIEGRENVEPGQKYIVMMNHVNMFDPLVLYSSFPDKARAIEEESHFRWPLYGWLIRRVGNLPVNRKNLRKAYDALLEAGRLIKERPEYSFAILPEGTRTMTGKLGPFKKGGFVLALEAGRPILPIVQLGSFRIKRKKKWLIRPGVVTVKIEKPIPPAPFSMNDINAYMKKVREVYEKYLD
jgi:1-acyl-sn-glycerol-3-phosphate acyltransferase